MPGSSKPLRQFKNVLESQISHYRKAGKSFAAAVALCWTILFIGFSAAVIATNMWLMGPQHFPFPMALCVIQQVVTTLCMWLLFRAKPKLFPGIQALRAEGNLAGAWFSMTPIAISITGAIYGSNFAYQYCSVSFVQMMKEWNLLVVFLASGLLGLEQFSWTGLSVIVVVFTGVLVAATGEIRFSLTGLAIQLGSQLLEVVTILAQSVLMIRGLRGVKLDPPSLVLLVSPLALLCLVGVLPFSYNGRANVQELIWTHAEMMWPYIIVNGLFACALNLVVAYAIKSLNATGFLLAGVLKDYAIVGFSVLLLHNMANMRQVIGFSVATLGILHYTLMKMYGDCFVDGNALRGFVRAYQRALLGFELSQYSLVEKQQLMDHQQKSSQRADDALA